jgi:hypothetical protein
MKRVKNRCFISIEVEREGKLALVTNAQALEMSLSAYLRSVLQPLLPDGIQLWKEEDGDHE